LAVIAIMGENRRSDAEKSLRLTLEEIERLMLLAEREGVQVEPWVEQLAAELRAAAPAPAADGAAVAGRMRSNPRDSLGAQAHLGPSAIKALKS
jgi:ribosomal protein L12E/L44/L45/RPP1/RPP2